MSGIHLFRPESVSTDELRIQLKLVKYALFGTEVFLFYAVDCN